MSGIAIVLKVPFMKSKFGWVKVRGVKFEKDIVIHTDGTVTKRDKKKSKALKPNYTIIEKS